MEHAALSVGLLSVTIASNPPTAEPSATTGVPMQTGVPPPTTATEEPTSGDDMSVNCRTPCSASFCSEDGTNKKRICAAAGYVASGVGDSFGPVVVCK